MSRRWVSLGAQLSVFTGMPSRPQGRIAQEYRGKLTATERMPGLTVYRTWLYAHPAGGMARTLANNLTFLVSGSLNLLLRSAPADVVIASSPPFFPLLAGPIAARRRRALLVLEVRDLWPDYLVEMGRLPDGVIRRALFALERRLLAGADLVITVTEPLRQRLIEKGVVPEKVIVAPNGVDTDAYYHDPGPLPLPEGTIPDGRFVVGYLGNFGAGQALEHVIEAAHLVEREDPSVEFVLVGDGLERARVEQAMAHLRPANCRLAPVLPRELTRRFYSACDACLVPLAPWPALAGALPTKFFEALACERPIVAAATGEIPRVLAEAGAGLAAPPGDPAALARAVLALRALSPAERAAMGRRGRAYVVEGYDRRAVADRLYRIFAAALDLRAST
ncbi:MAG: glycosyltransferase family 4 protein [Gemmatimonadetes bacterium]|nr:glycosyltransferase family 4 protein [Gemmatimonadota bacterium]MBK7923797.1 glycosyltransferase family 4 protein [Gemmatimonadota bacterium]MBK9069093.1 glycosyltransferase family 4 protein [Gemmatimonadota bacterium]